MGWPAELQSTVSAYSSVISTLTSESWVGPSSLAMAAAVTPYLSWMQATVAQATEAATQATAAATAYEAAFAAHVPPTEVAANRTQLASLVATNTFGQNTPAIAATEIQYAEMWAQDALAMEAYSGSSAAASNVTPFTPAPQITNGAGLAAQAAAVGQAAATSAGSAQSVLDRSHHLPEPSDENAREPRHQHQRHRQRSAELAVRGRRGGFVYRRFTTSSRFRLALPPGLTTSAC